MRTLIRDVTAITLDEQDRILQEADVAIDGDRILAVGEVPERFEPDEVIDGRERVALPAFFNAHCHAAMTLERGWAEDLPFDRWLNEKIWVAESALEEEDVYWGAAVACCEMIHAGVVGFGDHYFWMDQVARAVEESGMKANLAWCQFGTGVEHEVGGIGLEDTVRFVRHWHGAAEGRIRCVLGPHSPYMCPPEFLRRVVERAQELEVGIHLHAAESVAQVENSIERHGRTPVAHLDALGVFDVPTLAAHCIAANEEDMAILAEKGVHVAHTPKTYLKLAMGMAPLPRFLEHGVRVALGTDGPASNNDLNMLEVLRITGLYQKNALGKPEALPRTRLLGLATQASAQALGFAGSGVLAAGRPADLILLDTCAPHWFPRHDLAAGIVYAAHPSDVSHVMVDGELLMRDGVLVTLDEEQIRYEAERRAFRMVGTPMRQVRAYQG
ncbi:MAG: amidohydrolase [Anaerolineae bacterium]|jgi:5-methylthioadenosine/S-adenosylhomocysteine deaminase